MRQSRFMERQAHVSHQYRIESDWVQQMKLLHALPMKSQWQVKTMIVHNYVCTYKLFGDARTTRTAEVTICMILRRTAPSPSTVTEPKWIVTVDCQRDSSKTNARHREIASTKVYPGNALSPLCRCVYAGQDGLHGRKHKRHCSLLSCRELVTTCHTSNRTTVERRPTRASSVL